MCLKTAPIAVASRSFSRNPILRAELLKRYSNVTFNDAGKILDGNELVAFLRGHTKAITGLERLDDYIFVNLPELKVVSKYGVGLDMIDRAAMSKRGVLLGWTGGVNRRSVAELALSFAICLVHRVPQANLELRSGLWKPLAGRQLSGKTIGIIGCGHVGKELVQLLQPFGCKILVNDILDFPKFYQKFGVQSLKLEELLVQSDIVSLHVPYDHTTYNMLSGARLKLLKQSAILINTARGNIVDEAVLKPMLVDGKLAGAGFDVFGTEPPLDQELINLPQFLATPHIGGSAEEAILAMGHAAIEGLDLARDPLMIKPI